MHVELDVDFFDHPKTVDLRARIGDKNADVYPLRLWTWAAKYARNGFINTAQRLEYACGWQGDRGVLAEILVETGFLDSVSGGYKIHGWEDRSGNFFQQYERKLVRMREYARQKRAGGVTVERHEVAPSTIGFPPKLEEPAPAPPPAPKKEKPVGTPEGLAVTTRLVTLWNEGKPTEQHIRLTPKRRAKVEARLKDGFNAEQLARVVAALKASPRHNGSNENGWRAPGPEWVLENTERVEQWLAGNGTRMVAPARPSVRCGVCSDTGKIPTGVDTESRSVTYGPCTSCADRRKAQ